MKQDKLHYIIKEELKFLMEARLGKTTFGSAYSLVRNASSVFSTMSDKIVDMMGVLSDWGLTNKKDYEIDAHGEVDDIITHASKYSSIIFDITFRMEESERYIKNLFESLMKDSKIKKYQFNWVKQISSDEYIVNFAIII